MRTPVTRNTRHKQRGSRGQSLAELALILPVFLLLALFALDFGRLFFGYVTLNNMARVGADYASNHPDAWANNNTAQMQRYRDLIAASYDSINCTPNPATPPAPTFAGTRQPGQPVTVTLRCDFSLLTPLIKDFFGGPVTLAASSSFPVMAGCIGVCDGGTGSGPPPPPATNCRTVPQMTGMSLLGAKNAWVAAGFPEANFGPYDAADAGRTVESQIVTEPPNSEGCVNPERFVFSSVVVTLETLPPPPTATCLFVPNMLGMTVGQARDTWNATTFGGTFLPTGVDDRLVEAQVTNPPSNPDECLEPPADAEVVYGDPLPPAPPAPCLVPNFANTPSDDALTTWTGNGFTGSVTFKNPNRLPYTIKSQSIVGGTYIGCGVDITVSNTGNTN